jgi:hypothetical protein
VSETSHESHTTARKHPASKEKTPNYLQRMGRRLRSVKVRDVALVVMFLGLAFVGWMVWQLREQQPVTRLVVAPALNKAEGIEKAKAPEATPPKGFEVTKTVTNADGSVTTTATVDGGDADTILVNSQPASPGSLVLVQSPPITVPVTVNVTAAPAPPRRARLVVLQQGPTPPPTITVIKPDGSVTTTTVAK